MLQNRKQTHIFIFQDLKDIDFIGVAIDPPLKNG